MPEIQVKKKPLKRTRKREWKPFVPPPPFESQYQTICPDVDERTNQLMNWYLRLVRCCPPNMRALDGEFRPVRELALEFLNREFGTHLVICNEDSN